MIDCRKVEIGRIRITEPRISLLDEPSAGNLLHFRRPQSLPNESAEKPADRRLRGCHGDTSIRLADVFDTFPRLKERVRPLAGTMSGRSTRDAFNRARADSGAQIADHRRTFTRSFAAFVKISASFAASMKLAARYFWLNRM